jgi:hypothetical protein
VVLQKIAWPICGTVIVRILAPTNSFPMHIFLIISVILLACLAVILAVVYGFRRSNTSRRSLGRWLTTPLFLMLAVIGCSFDKTTARAGDPEDSSDDEMNGEDDPIRVKELNKTSEWLSFKALWKNLDLVEPSKKNGDAIYLMYQYTDRDDYQELNRQSDSLTKLVDVLEPRLYKLSDKGLIDSVEVELLCNACRSRIEYIFVGFHSMLTRMMPPPGQVEKESNIVELEKRIDLLLELRKKGRVNEEELNLAVENIKGDIRLYGALDVLTSGLGYRIYNVEFFRDSAESGDAYMQKVIASFEESRLNFLKKYDPKKADETEKSLFETYERTHLDIERYKAILPRVGELLNDLILND